MAESPKTTPDPTTVPTGPAGAAAEGSGDQHVDSLKKAYDKLAAEVHATAPNTPERHRAMEAKKTAFQKYNEAANAKQELDGTTAIAEQKQVAAESAAREAQAAKDAAKKSAHARPRTP